MYTPVPVSTGLAIIGIMVTKSVAAMYTTGKNMFTLIGLCKSGWVKRSTGMHKTDTPMLNWNDLQNIRQQHNMCTWPQVRHSDMVRFNFIIIGYYIISFKRTHVANPT